MSKEKIQLRRPILINGEEVKELTYDIEELTINHIARAEGMKSKVGGAELAAKFTLAQTDYPLQICIGMQAILAVNKNIAEEDLMRVKGHDLTKIAAIGTSFFIEPEENESEANTSEKLQEDTQNTTTVR